MIQPIWCLLLATQGNDARDTEFCVMGDDFRKAVIESDGFEWQNDQLEGKTPKVCTVHKPMLISLLI